MPVSQKDRNIMAKKQQQNQEAVGGGKNPSHLPEIEQPVKTEKKTEKPVKKN